MIFRKVHQLMMSFPGPKHHKRAGEVDAAKFFQGWIGVAIQDPPRLIADESRPEARQQILAREADRECFSVQERQGDILAHCRCIRRGNINPHTQRIRLVLTDLVAITWRAPGQSYHEDERDEGISHRPS